MSSRRNESGAVTAETAVVIPVLVLLTAVLAWMVTFGVNQARVVDAARETARSVARGDSQERGTELGLRVAPAGSRIEIRQGADQVTVTVKAEVSGPGGLFGLLPGHTVRAQAVAAREDTG